MSEYEHSERGRYVTEQVTLWIENDGKNIESAKKAAKESDAALKECLVWLIKYSPRSSAAWQVRQELATNDFDRIDWAAVRASVLDIE